MSYENDEQQRHITTTVEQDESVSAKAKETGQILKELIASIGKKTKTVAEEKSKQLKEAADDKDIAVKDAIDIQMLGSHIDGIVSIFDSTMDRISQQPHDEQQRLLVGLKKMLQEETYVINARLNMAKRLKALESSATQNAVVEDRIRERIEMNATDTEVIAPPPPPVSEEETTTGFAVKEEIGRS